MTVCQVFTLKSILVCSVGHWINMYGIESGAYRCWPVVLNSDIFIPASNPLDRCDLDTSTNYFCFWSHCMGKGLGLKIKSFSGWHWFLFTIWTSLYSFLGKNVKVTNHGFLQESVCFTSWELEEFVMVFHLNTYQTIIDLKSFLNQPKSKDVTFLNLYISNYSLL